MLTSLSKEILLKLGTYIVLVLQFASVPVAAKDGEYTTKTFRATFLISMIFFIYLFTHFFFWRSSKVSICDKHVWVHTADAASVPVSKQQKKNISISNQ